MKLFYRLIIYIELLSNMIEIDTISLWVFMILMPL
jgi:hypothetical protein